jgi:hypothetical protein
MITLLDDLGTFFYNTAGIIWLVFIWPYYRHLLPIIVYLPQSGICHPCLNLLQGYRKKLTVLLGPMHDVLRIFDYIGQFAATTETYPDSESESTVGIFNTVDFLKP